MEEKSSFRIVFGDSPIVKVIDFFLDNREFDYSLTDIAKNADIGWSTLHGFWDNVVKLGIVVKTRKIGRATLYKINQENVAIKQLMELYDHLLLERLNHIEKETRQKVAIPA